MQRSTAKRRVATAAPQAAIVLQAPGTRDDGTRFSVALLVFMRVVAAVWILQGLLQWTAVLTTGAGGTSTFSALAPPAQVAAVFFAVVDFVAAIGLWLAAPWGGVIWLVAALMQVVVLILMPAFFDHPLVTGLFDVALSAAYLALVWFAAQAGDVEG